jgi:transketolase
MLINSKYQKLYDLANILRRDSIEATTVAGSGHPTSCMSCAEILSVLFFNEMSYDIKNPNNPDNDEFILSKGHAAPILYSALKRSGCISHDLKTLRKISSPLEGHPMPGSLPWAKVATGSLGQGLSIGIGFALAAKLQSRPYKTYVLLGDSESAEGSVFEALQLAAHHKLNNLVAIIDVNRLGETGETILGHDVKAYKKLASAFGWKPLVIEGHKIEQIVKAFDKARKSKSPTLIIAKTFKGKGFSLVENQEHRHGKAFSPEEAESALSQIPNPQMPIMTIPSPRPIKYSPKTRPVSTTTSYKPSDLVATRDAYGSALAKLAKNEKIITVDAELSDSTRSDKLRKVSKEYVEAFIAEQNMVGIALGLSKKGFLPFTSTFAAFYTRAHDQIRMASYSQPNFTLCGSHSGVSIGEDGASQMGLEDISLFRSLPNSIVLYPSDAVSTEKLTFLTTKLQGLKYIRTTRPATPILYKNTEEFKLGDFKVLKKSLKDKAILVGSGITLHESIKAHDFLKQKNINTAVIDLYSIKPFDSKKFIQFVRNHGNKIIVTEDHRPEGGIGEMLSSVLINTNIKLKHLSVQQIPHSGSGSQLLETQNINAKAIMKSIKGL